MVESLLRTAPHVTTVFQADMSAVLADRDRHKAEFERQGYPLTLTAYFVAACVAAIREVPEANSRWTEDAILVHERIDIGIGTALPGRGLVVPVIRDAGRLDLPGIAAALGTLVAKARDDALTPADLQGGTFTISNHGVSGSLVAAPIVIYQPQSAILGVGKLEKRAVVASEGGEDRVVVRPCCYVTLTIDHRALDGHQANRFMETLVRRLEGWS
jgi:2-oxoglutarate dehydrogenase E2 component (dihydrolipoamide succinyltransferase)